MGTNLSSVKYYSSQQPFLNEFKSSKSWITQSDRQWDTGEADLLDLDPDGWLKSLPSDDAEARYTKVGTLFFRGHGDYLPGRYIVLYEGEGTLEYQFDAEKNQELSTPGRDVLEVNPSETGIFLTITETDPDGTGDYLRNIRIVPEAEELSATTSSFNSEFLEKIEPFGTLRFMDWMETNNSQQKEWSERPTISDARYSEIGVPVDIMVELANQTDTNPWFTIPHMATDEYVSNFARYVKENLEPDLEVYVEYSNEVWNGGFEQNQWVKEQAAQNWSNSELNGLDWYGMRTTEVVEIWEREFATDSSRVIGVMGAQAANPGAGENLLEYRWSDTPLSHSDTGIDTIAIAPYFGRYLGDPQHTEEIESWTTESDGGLNKLFQELSQGGVLSNGPEGGALAEAATNIENYVGLAERENLQLVTYEGGQHIVGFKGVENNQALTDLFISANQDPRMTEIYQDYLEDWSNLGGDLFVHYSDIRTSNKWGSWGALESVYQETSPKYDALIEFLEEEPDNSLAPPTASPAAPAAPAPIVDKSDSEERTIGEVGRILNFDHNIQTITLDNSYSNPVLFALPVSGEGSHSAIARIGEIQSDRFTVFLQEPEYLDGTHVRESLSYLVLEAGSWQLSDGSILEVGLSNFTQSTASIDRSVDFANSFETTPIVLSQVQTNNDEEFVRTRQHNPSINGFSLTLEEEEALKESGHGTETVGWLAIEPGVSLNDDFTYQASRTGNEVTDDWHSIDFELEFDESPHFLASVASYNDADPVGIRYQNLNSSGVEIMLEEELSFDRETQHDSEVVDYLAIANTGSLSAVPFESL